MTCLYRLPGDCQGGGRSVPFRRLMERLLSKSSELGSWLCLALPRRSERGL